MSTAADGQLCHDIGGKQLVGSGHQCFANVAGRNVANISDIDLVDAFRAAHAGDARAAIRELLLDADFLRDQLGVAAGAISAGLVRGWRPKYERP